MHQPAITTHRLPPRGALAPADGGRRRGPAGPPGPEEIEVVPFGLAHHLGTGRTLIAVFRPLDRPGNDVVAAARADVGRGPLPVRAVPDLVPAEHVVVGGQGMMGGEFRR